MSTASVGKKAGVRNYNNTLLLDIIEAILPQSNEDFRPVCQRYAAAVGEPERDPASVKRHFWDKLCKKGTKPTGQSGDAKDFILRAQRIHAKILHKGAMQSVGGDEDDYDEEELPNAEEDDDFDLAEEEKVEEKEAEDSDSEDPPQPPKKKVCKEDKKTKNCKISGTPRGSAASALNKLADAVISGGKKKATNNEGGGNEMQMMMMQIMMQMQQRSDMMLMRMMGIKPSELPSMATPISTTSSSSSSSFMGNANLAVEED